MRMLGVALLAALLACGALAQEYAPVEFVLGPDEAETLRASFDRGLREDLQRGLEADFARGSREVVPTAYDRGIPKDINLYRAISIDDGASGKAIRLHAGRAHRYAAAGNINLRRGTIAFWTRFSQPLGNVHLPIMMVNRVGRTGTIVALRGSYKRVLCHGPWGGSYDAEATPWEGDTWYHLTVTWDELTGLRLYRNGQLTRAQEMTWHTEDLEPGYLFLGSWDHWGGTPVPLDFDELRVFSRPLTDDEVARVHAGEEGFDAVSHDDSDAVSAHRLEYLGWETCPDMAGIEPAAGDGTLLVRTIGIEDTRAVKTDAWKVTDGDRVTRWPLTYHGYSFQREAGLALKLFEGEPWDYLRIWGPCNGAMYEGRHILRPDGEPMMPLAFEGPLLTRAFDGPMTQREMTVFADELPEDSEDRAARVGEIGFFSVGPAQAADVPGSAQVCYLTAQQWADWDSEIGLQMLSRFEPYDRSALRLSAQAQAEARSLPMKSMRYYHLMLEPASADRPLAAIRASLHFRDLSPGTVIWLRAMDPLVPTRHIADFEVRARGEWSGVQRADLTLDMRDHVIPNGLPVWLTLMTSEDAELVWDAEHASRIELLVTGANALADEYLHDQVKFVKDRFIDMSEPRPWGKVAMADLANRVGVFMELHRSLQDVHDRFPADAGANAFYIWTHPKEPADRSHLLAPEVAGAPEWAVYQRAAYVLYRDFVNWWIEERQVDNGEFGHGLGDDTDLINDWLSVAAVSDTDGRIADSVRRLADTCWEVKLTDGINTRSTDPLHAYEEGVNAIARAAEMHYGNPVYLERLMTATRATRERFTGETGGHLHFTSRLYGANAVITEPPYDQDSLSSTLMLHPALYLGWYSRNQYAMDLVREYGDSWLDLWKTAVAEGGPLGTSDNVKLPSTVRFEDRSVVGSGKYPRGYGHASMFLALQEWYGERDYPLVMRVWLERDSLDADAQLDWLPFMDLSPWMDSLLERTAAITYDDLRPSMGNDTRTEYQYLDWQLTGNRKAVLEALRDSWQRIALLFPMHTWAEQSNDRVAVSKDLVDRLYLGGTPGFRNMIYPTHAISWQGFSPDFAAWVLESDYERLKLMAWNFEDAPQVGTIRVYRLRPGVYRVTIGPDADEDGVPDADAQATLVELARNSELQVTLPPGQVTAVSIELQAASKEYYFGRPDLAICPQDTVISEDATEVTVVVHNIGGGDAPKFAVRIIMDGEETVLDATAGPLEAPADCVPRMLELRWPVPDNLRGRQFWVVVDPDDELGELFEGNNIVELPAG